MNELIQIILGFIFGIPFAILVYKMAEKIAIKIEDVMKND